MKFSSQYLNLILLINSGSISASSFNFLSRKEEGLGIPNKSSSVVGLNCDSFASLNQFKQVLTKRLVNGQSRNV